MPTKYKITDPDTGKVYNTTAESREEAVAKIEAYIAANKPAADAGGTAPAPAAPAAPSPVAGGRSIIEQLTDPNAPIEAVGDMARIAMDTGTFGGYDKLVDFIASNAFGYPEGRQAELTKQARERAGGASTGMDLALMMAAPSKAAGYAKPAARALGFGAEGGAMAAADAVGHGERDPWEIAKEAGLGMGLSFGGAAAGDLVSGTSKYLKGKPAKYPTNESYLKAAGSARRNTKEGKDLYEGSGRLKDAIVAKAKGPEGFRELAAKNQGINEAAKRYGAREGPIPFKEIELATKAGHNPPQGTISRALNATGDAMMGGKNALSQAGVGFKWPILPIIGTALKATSNIPGALRYPKTVEELMSTIRQSGAGAPPFQAPGDLELMRQYLAMAMRGTQGGE